MYTNKNKKRRGEGMKKKNKQKKPCTATYCDYWSRGFKQNCSAPQKTVSGINPETCPRYTNK
jgi:hypothetical protein